MVLGGTVRSSINGIKRSAAPKEKALVPLGQRAMGITFGVTAGITSVLL